MTYMVAGGAYDSDAAGAVADRGGQCGVPGADDLFRLLRRGASEANGP